MTARRTIAVAAMLLLALTATVNARPLKNKIQNQQVTFLPHPPGCPGRLFCGCGASVRVFGRAVRSLWPSTAWFKFPRAAPGHLKVAVRRGHVFVIDYMLDAKTAMAWDYNSGQRKSRYHARSIAMYKIVDPHASRVAMR